MDTEILQINTIDSYNSLFGLETRHPLVAVVDLADATRFPSHFTMNYGIYALFLKQTRCGDIRYGRQTYDYQEGTVTSFAPGQVVEVNMEPGFKPKARGLLFHPDLIRGTSLGQGIKNYSFFDYSSAEALHLSDEEKVLFSNCLDQIATEIERPIDKFSRRLIARNIELLLGSEKTISEISYELGYQYSQHFNRIFKKKVSFCAFLRHCIAIITYLYRRIKTTNIFKYEKIIYSPFDCGCCGRY